MEIGGRKEAGKAKWGFCLEMGGVAILILRFFWTFLMIQPGLFPVKSAATVFNNKIELLEKAEGQGPGVFRLLSFRFLGYERPPETLKGEHLTIN